MASTFWWRHPGRLLDLVQQKHIRLDAVSTFIVDEADRMLDMGFIRDVRKIVALLPKQRQSMLFSATMPDDIVKLVGDMLHQPERIEVAPQGKTADRITQKLYFVPTPQKRQLLMRAAEGRGAEPRHRLHPHQAWRQQAWPSISSRTGVVSDAIHGNKIAECPPARAGDLPRRQGPRAGGHRHRRPRHRYRRYLAMW